MILPLLQVILTAVLVAYAGFWRRQQMKRRAKSWDGIISQLRCNDWGIEEISEQSVPLVRDELANRVRIAADYRTPHRQRLAQRP